MKHPASIIEKARNLRKEGLSYNKISSLLKISKSTLHYWFLELPPSAFQSDPVFRLSHLRRIQPLATAAIKAKRINRIEKVREVVNEQLSSFPYNNLLTQKAIVAFLYWAEGAKTKGTAFKFANTDPALSLLFITLLRNSYIIDEKNIRIVLYLHYYHSVSKSLKFWSTLLNVPKEQFEKTYIKSRRHTKKHRKNFAGICFIKYGKGGQNLKEEVLYFGKAIQEKLAPMPNAPVV